MIFVEFVYKSILFIFASIIKLLLPDVAIKAWRDWILKRSIRLTPDGYSLRGGFMHNPLKGYPRNFRCWCGSNEKAKVCCLPDVSPVCSPKEAFANKYTVKFAELLMKESHDNEKKSSSEHSPVEI